MSVLFIINHNAVLISLMFWLYRSLEFLKLKKQNYFCKPDSVNGRNNFLPVAISFLNIPAAHKSIHFFFVDFNCNFIVLILRLYCMPMICPKMYHTKNVLYSCIRKTIRCLTVCVYYLTCNIIYKLQKQRNGKLSFVN